MEMLIEYVEVNSKKYKLQHPGNREVIKLRTRCVDSQKGTTDLEQLMDYCFEHVVIPQDHNFKPTIDAVHPKEFEEWLEIVPGFLRHGHVGRFESVENGTEESREASTE